MTVAQALLNEVIDRTGNYCDRTLQPHNLTRIVELNLQYADVNPVFADLALVAISERLDIAAIASLDTRA